MRYFSERHSFFLSDFVFDHVTQFVIIILTFYFTASPMSVDLGPKLHLKLKESLKCIIISQSSTLQSRMLYSANCIWARVLQMSPLAYVAKPPVRRWVSFLLLHLPFWVRWLPLGTYTPHSVYLSPPLDCPRRSYHSWLLSGVLFSTPSLSQTGQNECNPLLHLLARSSWILARHLQLDSGIQKIHKQSKAWPQVQWIITRKLKWKSQGAF